MVSKYFAATAVMENSTKLVSVKRVIVTATAAGGSAVLKVGGAAGTTVADMRVGVQNDSSDFELGDCRCDHIVLTNANATVLFE